MKRLNTFLRKTLFAGLVLLLTVASSNGQCITLAKDLAHDTAIVVSSLAPATNYPTTYGYQSAVLAEQWTNMGSPIETRGLFKFDLSVVPANAITTSASISLYADTANTTNGSYGNPTYGNNNACNLQLITSPWVSQLATWNNQPTTTTTGQVLLPQSTNTAQNYPNIDITGFVKTWLQSPSTNYGMMLKMITTNYYNSLIFCSSTYPDSSKRPSLVICYTPCAANAQFSYQIGDTGVVHFTSNILSGYTGKWMFSNSAGVFDSSTLQNPSIHVTGLPPYTATLQVHNTTNTNCVDVSTVILNIVTCSATQTNSPLSTETYISNAYPNINYYGSPDFNASHWVYNGTPTEHRGLLKFDLSAVPQGSIVVSANLSLYANSTSVTSGNGIPSKPTYGANNACTLMQITSPWSEKLVTWNTQPTTSTINQVALPQSVDSVQDYLNLDVTNIVTKWVQNPSSNYGLLLKMIDSLTNNSMIFCSSTNPDVNKRPQLSVCYIPNAGACTAAFGYANTGNTVNFSNLSSPISSYWTFGDGDTSHALNPSHAYAQNGNYYVVLSIVDTNGTCADTVEVNVSGIQNDTICGLIYWDKNNNGVYDIMDEPLAYNKVLIDGIEQMSDSTGYYKAVIGGGSHIVSYLDTASIAQYWNITSPYWPSVYHFETKNNQYICGLDFGLYNEDYNYINNIYNTQLAVYPNPSTGNSFSIQLPDSWNEAQTSISVFDIIGNAIAIRQAEKKNNALSVSMAGSIAPGIYTIVIISNSQRYTGMLSVIN